jgi:uncharacterized membrane protein YgcG
VELGSILGKDGLAGFRPRRPGESRSGRLRVRRALLALAVPIVVFGVAFALGAATRTKRVSRVTGSPAAVLQQTTLKPVTISAVQNPPALKIAPKPRPAPPHPAAAPVSGPARVAVAPVAPRRSSSSSSRAPVSSGGGGSSSRAAPVSSVGTGSSGGGGSSSPVSSSPSPVSSPSPSGGYTGGGSGSKSAGGTGTVSGGG